MKLFYNRLYTNVKKLKKTKSCENFLNSSNTLNQFFTKDEVYVTKLKFFEPGNIILALKDTVDVIGLDNNLSDDILHTLDAISEKNKKKEDEKQTDL